MSGGWQSPGADAPAGSPGRGEMAGQRHGGGAA
jgi:hypothetical protein